MEKINWNLYVYISHLCHGMYFGFKITVQRNNVFEEDLFEHQINIQDNFVGFPLCESFYTHITECNRIVDLNTGYLALGLVFFFIRSVSMDRSCLSRLKSLASYRIGCLKW